MLLAMNSDNQAAESSSSKTEGEGNGIFRGANTIDPQYATYVKAVYSDMAGRGGAAVADVASKNPGAERGGRITSSPGDDFQSSLHSKRHLYNRMRQQLTKTSPTSADPRAVLGAGETQDGLPPPPPPPIKTYTTSERTLIEKALRETKLTVAEQRVAVCHFLHSDSIIFIFILFLDVPCTRTTHTLLNIFPFSYYTNVLLFSTTKLQCGTISGGEAPRLGAACSQARCSSARMAFLHLRHHAKKLRHRPTHGEIGAARGEGLGKDSSRPGSTPFSP